MVPKPPPSVPQVSPMTVQPGGNSAPLDDTNRSKDNTIPNKAPTAQVTSTPTPRPSVSPSLSPSPTPDSSSTTDYTFFWIIIVLLLLVIAFLIGRQSKKT
jgi:hypothetical protein